MLISCHCYASTKLLKVLVYVIESNDVALFEKRCFRIHLQTFINSIK